MSRSLGSGTGMPTGYDAQIDELIEGINGGAYGAYAQNEYDIIINNLYVYGGKRDASGANIGIKAISFFIQRFDESWNAPNRFYTKLASEINPGIYWSRLNGAIMNPDIYDVSGAWHTLTKALFSAENPHGMGIFTPTGIGRAGAILEFVRDQAPYAGIKI